MTVEIDKLAGPGSDEGHRLAKFWRDQIDQTHDDKEHKRWVKRGESIERRYRDERNRVDEEGHRRYNSLWTNIEILYPALYGKCPVPVAERRFRDKDPTGRGAAQILERSLRNEIEINGFDEGMRQAVRDYLLPGRGTVWVRYEPEIEESISLAVESKVDVKDGQGWIGDSGIETELEETETEEEESGDHLRETGDSILRESTPVDYVPWQDFRSFPARARVWAEVTAVAKRVYMSRSQMCARFGKEIGRAIPLERDDRQKGQNTSVESTDADKGIVWEIWSRDKKSVYWVAEGYEYLCDKKDDPLRLENFFPCPRPLYANPTNNTLVPVPDYIQYQDQAIQIDELTQRIALLTKACKVAGVYNAAAKSISRLLNESVENELIPVDDWAAFAEKGGVEGNISLLPIKEIMGVLQELMIAKEKQIEEQDRLTGITDLMRGTTDARETLGGQRLKSNSSGTRLTHRQNEVARFARDTLRIMADIMAQHFSPQSLIAASGALYEEGLGAPDMPSLSSLDESANQGSLPNPPTQPGLPGPALSPPGAGPPMSFGPMPGSPPGMVPPGGAFPPGVPPGQNVIPFKPPSVGGQQMAPRPALGGPPALNAGVPPPIPPEILNKLKGLQRIADAIHLLRDEKMRGFRVDIEVDSTIYGDQQEEKGDRVQFITTVTQFLQQAMMMAAQVPEIMPLLGKFLQFGVRGFRVGRDLEAAIEDFCDEAVGIAKRHAAAAAQQPNPLVIKAEAEKVKAQATIQSAQISAGVEQVRAQNDIRSAQLDAEAREREAEAEIQRQMIENQGEQANSEADVEAKRMDLEMREIEFDIEKLQLKAAKIKANADIKKANAAARKATADAKKPKTAS